jgi:beta-glucosidase
MIARSRSSILAATAAVAVAVGAAVVGPAALAADAPHVEGRSPAIAPDAPWTKTVNYLVGQMTPAEEMNLIEGSWANKTSVDTTLDPDSHNQAGYVRGVKRLGIPESRHADALGIEVFADATAFPTRLGLAASFDRGLINEFGETVGDEGKAMDVDLLYGPQVDLARTPSWARNMTAYSEDPYLAAQLTAEEINGIQSTGLMSQVKHVSFYSGQTQSTPSLVDEQAAREIYLAPAEAAAKDAGVTSMMCSYATFQILGFESKPDYACSNGGMLNSIVKGDWKFPGWITTDYGGGKAPSDLLAGTDQEFLTTFFSNANLLPLIDPTSSSYDPAYGAAARESVARILYQYERFGLLDNSKIPAGSQSSVPQHGNVDVYDNSIHIDKGAGIEEARKLAEAAATLLKNDDGVLPLASSTSVAVMGQSARLLPASPGGERAGGFGDRVTITPLKAMKAIGDGAVTSVPGIDLLGDTVPATALSTDAAGTIPGLTRTTTEADGTTSAAIDSALTGAQTNLAKGKTYTWTGYVNAATADTYRLVFQRPYGTDLGNDAKYNQSIRNASNSTLTLQVDGANTSLPNPDSKVLPNAYPTYASGVAGVTTTARNGQYLGYQNVAARLALTAGRHQITITYKPSATAATTPTLRFAWSATSDALAQATAAAGTKDVSVVYVDDSSTTTGDGVSAQTDVAQLSAEQNTLVTQVTAAAHAAGHKVVVVLNTGGAVQMPWADSVDSILEMWYPGQEGGTATANTLYGLSNPSGKLTLSFPRNSTQTLFGGHPERGSGTQEPGEASTTIKWTEGLDIGYRWFASAENTSGYTPLFAFGHGLSYTSYAYSDLKAQQASNGGIDVSFAVKNTGSVAGYESPQVYVGPSDQLPGGLEQPAVKLAQFDHVALAPGESRTVSLNISPRSLSSWSPAKQDWVLAAGGRQILVGAASDDIRLSTTDVAGVPSTPTPGGSGSSAGSGATTGSADSAAGGDASGTPVAPLITSNPDGTIRVTAGKRVTLTAAASGSPSPDVVWQKSVDSGKTWTTVTGATSSTFAFTATGRDDRATFRAVFHSSAGDATSTVTTLRVSKATPKVALSLSHDRISASSRGTASVIVSAPSGLVASGKVTLSVTRRGRAVRSTTVTLKRGSARWTLPKLSSGTYTIKAAYAGNTDLAAVTATSRTLTAR